MSDSGSGELIIYDGITCKADASIFGVVLGVLLSVGIFGSYLPQHVALYRGKTSEGLSLRTVLVANLSGFTISLVTMVASWSDFHCCASPEISIARCMRTSVLPLIQISVGWWALVPMYVMALYYHPRRTIQERVQVYREIVIFWVYVGFMVLTTAIAAILLLTTGSLSSATTIYVYVIGVIAIIVTCFMWTPQIWQVFKQKGQGALSFVMLLIQAPGAFLVVIYQGILSHTGPATWVPYLITGFSQVVLIAQVIFYWIKNRDGPCYGKNKLEDGDLLPELRSTEELTGLIADGHVQDLDEFAESDLAYLSHGEISEEDAF